MPANSPPSEVEITVELVREMLRRHFPTGAELPLQRVAYGWDNDVYRLGPHWAVRLPRRQAAADLVVHEQQWLGELSGRLPLPVPAPILVGPPDLGYPWPWSVVPWFEGDIAARTPPADPESAATTLARFLVALHQPAPSDAPVNPFRGGALATRHTATTERIALLTADDALDPYGGAAPLVEAWDHARTAPGPAGPPRWLHGDLHPANILVRQGRLSAVIDFGDLTAGDPATDLAVAWMLFDLPARATFRAAYDTGRAWSDPTDDPERWRRARGWALNFALAVLAGSADQPTMTAIGRRTLEAVLRDPDRRGQGRVT